MKKLFWASLLLILIFASCTTSYSDKETIRDGYYLSGTEAVAFYSSSKDKSPRVSYNLAYSFLESGNIERALETAIEAKNEYPLYIRFYLLEAYCYRELGEKERYLNSLNEIISLDYSNKEVRELIIVFYIDEGMDEKAIEEARILLSIDSNNEIALNALSMHIPFFCDLTGYKQDENRKEIIENINKIEIVNLKPKLNKVPGTLLSD